MDDLVARLDAAFARLPDAGDVAGYRAGMIAAPGKLPAVMRRAEAMAEAGALPVGALAELWTWTAYLELVLGYRGQTTVQQYARSLSRFLEWAHAGSHDYAMLPLSGFDAWQKWLAVTLRHGPRWRGRQVIAVRGFYGWRSSRGIGQNCAGDLHGPREPIGMPRKYTLPQLQGMLAATGKRRNSAMVARDRALMLFLLATGARREETSAVSLTDLHLGQRTGIVRFHGKGAKEREVPFEGPVVDLLHDWLLQRDQLSPEDHAALFVGIAGPMPGKRLSVSAIERVVKFCALDAGLRDWGVHRFRITFATTLYDDGAGIEEIRRLMGHESIETTRRYLAVSERMRRTRMKSDRLHEVMGTRNTGRPRWMQAALGGSGE